jgi:hypothetical protein
VTGNRTRSLGRGNLTCCWWPPVDLHEAADLEDANVSANCRELTEIIVEILRVLKVDTELEFPWRTPDLLLIGRKCDALGNNRSLWMSSNIAHPFRTVRLEDECEATRSNITTNTEQLRCEATRVAAHDALRNGGIAQLWSNSWKRGELANLASNL